jgi:hypothetical protein
MATTLRTCNSLKHSSRLIERNVAVCVSDVGSVCLSAGRLEDLSGLGVPISTSLRRWLIRTNLSTDSGTYKGCRNTPASLAKRLASSSADKRSGSSISLLTVGARSE